MSDIKSRIINAALHLLLKHGPKSVTMDHISEHCGISKRTLYEQFNDKNELLTRCLDIISEEQKTIRKDLAEASKNAIEYIAASTKNTIEASYRFNPNFFLELKKYYPKIAEIQMNVLEEVFFTELHDTIANGVKEGLFREELNIPLVVRLFKPQFEVIYYSDMLLKNNFSLPETINTLIFTFLRGIATAAGLEIVTRYENEVTAG